MTTSQELMMAILSMDAYNRGYGAGITDPTAQGGGLGVSQSGGPTYSIGTATILTDADDPAGEAQAAGFYALAYEWNGETIICYRGTDDLSIGFSGELLGANFPIFAEADFTQDQLALASQFYQSVDAVNGTDPIHLTGHSLGGALAGFTSALYGADASLVDHIGFQGALQSFRTEWEKYS